MTRNGHRAQSFPCQPPPNKPLVSRPRVTRGNPIRGNTGNWGGRTPLSTGTGEDKLKAKASYGRKRSKETTAEQSRAKGSTETELQKQRLSPWMQPCLKPIRQLNLLVSLTPKVPFYQNQLFSISEHKAKFHNFPHTQKGHVTSYQTPCQSLLPQ